MRQWRSRQVDDEPSPSVQNTTEQSSARANSRYRLYERHLIAAANSREVAVGQQDRLVVAKPDHLSADRNPVLAHDRAYGSQRGGKTGDRNCQSHQLADAARKSHRKNSADLFG